MLGSADGGQWIGSSGGLKTNVISTTTAASSKTRELLVPPTPGQVSVTS
jgi:hypothetical protein